MSDFKVNVNFDRLKTYFPNLTPQQKALLIEQGGITIDFESEYYDEVYPQLYEGLSIILTRYHLEDHINELYYIIILLDNQYQEVRFSQEEAYNDDKTAKELAQFLLTFKNAQPKQAFQLVAKSLTDTAAVKNPDLAKWLCQVIYDAIEARSIPFDLFGEQIYLHLFGMNPLDGEPISKERLETSSELSIRKPKFSNLLFKFCLHLRTYLNDETELKTTGSVLLSDVQANLFFDIFEFMGYVNKEKIQSEPKDYMHTLFRNQLKVNPS